MKLPVNQQLASQTTSQRMNKRCLDLYKCHKQHKCDISNNVKVLTVASKKTYENYHILRKN